MQYYTLYLLALNLTGFLICIYDKRAAIKKRSRISERTLFAVALIGGAVGMYIGMLIVRHKTRHWYFMVFIPIIIVLQMIFTGYLLML